MPGTSRKKELMQAVGFLLFPILMVAVSLLADRTGIVPAVLLDDFSRGVFRICIIVFGLIALVVPYLQQNQFRAALEHSDLSPAVRELRFLSLGLSFSATPAIFAFVLFLLGDPLRYAVYGAIASFIGAAAWSYYVLRAGPGEVDP